MKKTILTIAVAIVLLMILLFAAYMIWLKWGEVVTKTELYESGEEKLEIEYHRNGSISFKKESKTARGGFSCGADFINENTAVLDGKNMLPEMGIYYEFVFHDGYVELYDYGELIGRYTLVEIK